jgi:3-oxoadipate enol-lactonase/4-carboxymuconolactone decarboxylase
MSELRLRGSVTPAPPTAAMTGLLVLLPSLGTTTELWDGVVGRLRSTPNAPRILRVDLPGHGVSPVARAPFTVSDLAEAVLALVDEIGGGAFRVAGDSLGGAIALELAARAPERVLAAGLFCTGAAIGTPESWAERAAAVRASGTPSLVAGSAQRWFAPDYLATHPDGPGSQVLRTLMDVDDESYALCCGALAAFDRRADLGCVSVPVLVVAGGHDGVTTAESMRGLAAGFDDARFVEVAEASHLLPLEAPDAAASLIGDLMLMGDTRAGGDRGDAVDDDDADADDAYDLGMATRRAVLGDEHVDRAQAAITAQTRDFQRFITRYAWGEVWTRPGLTRAERSIATLASLVTGGHESELRMHLRAALRNGLTHAQIAEVIHHTALYAGLPAANSAMAVMREVFAETPPPTP